MRLESIDVFPLKIPFVETFNHALKNRSFSDTVLFKLQFEGGAIGWGETLVREYVTGETVDLLLDQVKELPKAIWNLDWKILKQAETPEEKLTVIHQNLAHILSEIPLKEGLKAWNGMRCGLELGIIDGLLRVEGLSLSDILLPAVKEVVYSGVITAGSAETALRSARQMKQIGIKDFKLKISGLGDVNLVRDIRELLGPNVTLRLDANAAFNLEDAVRFCKEIESLNISAIEEPLREMSKSLLAKLQSTTTIPVMPDESLVTVQDAYDLLSAGGTRMFNIRLAKCGGLVPSLELVSIARKNSIGFQLGALVGETGILSAAGRIFAAYHADCAFVEGSYGTLLLQEDIVSQSIRFGFGGRAPIMKGLGLSVDVVEDKVIKYACSEKILHLITPLRD
jgi:L-alanine-DL-glutamate epimerase-like enolase superfamily enzyme